MTLRGRPTVSGAALAASLLCGAAAPAPAQVPDLNGATVEGRVVDARTGAPLRGVQVTIEGLTVGTVTDPQGQYRLSQLPPGRRTVVARMLGYKPARTDVVLLDGTNSVPELLMHHDVVALEHIVVEGTFGAGFRWRILPFAALAAGLMVLAHVERRPYSGWKKVLAATAGGAAVGALFAFSALLTGAGPAALLLPLHGVAVGGGLGLWSARATRLT